MDDVSLDDGLEGPESLAFGLGVMETGAMVVALLAAWACVATMPAALGWPGGVLLVAGGALLGWGRHDERSFLEWSLLASRFVWRRRRDLGGRIAAAVPGWLRAPLRRAARGERRLPVGRRGGGVAAPEGVVLPLVLPRMAAHEAAAPPRIVGFFSLRGGSGRTALACAVAARLAAVGRLPDRHAWRILRVAVVDLDALLPAASMRWGAALGGPPRRHNSGATIHPAPLGDEPAATVRVDEAAAAADVVVVDARWQEGAQDLLVRCTDIVVVTEPSPAGVLDAYRSVAWLRRHGLRERLLLVANRCPPTAVLDDVETDLGVAVVARIPPSHDLDGEDGVAVLAAVLNQRLLGGGGCGRDGVAAEAG
ncbi:MAG: hypothetical protein ACYDAC_06845 [Candidatus Dormibacteria bacterium]